MQKGGISQPDRLASNSTAWPWPSNLTFSVLLCRTATGPWGSVAVDVSSQAVVNENFLFLYICVPVADRHRIASLQKALGGHKSSRSQEGWDCLGWTGTSEVMPRPAVVLTWSLKLEVKPLTTPDVIFPPASKSTSQFLQGHIYPGGAASRPPTCLCSVPVNTQNSPLKVDSVSDRIPAGAWRSVWLVTSRIARQQGRGSPSGLRDLHH